MIRAVLFALLVVAVCAYPRAASATACTVPNLVVNGQYVDATKLAANFSALASCSGNIDNSNIGAAGLYASQLLPTTVAQATFGGSQAYVFNNGLTITAGGFAVTGNSTLSGSLTLGGGIAATGANFSGPVNGGLINANTLALSGTGASLSLGGGSLTGAGNGTFGGTVSVGGIVNSGTTSTGQLVASGAVVVGASGYIQANSLTPSQCVNTLSNDVLASQPCNYFSLNGLQPTVSLTSTGGTLSVTPSGSTIDLESTYSPPANIVKSNSANNEIIIHGLSNATSAGTVISGLPYTSSTNYSCTVTQYGTTAPTTNTPSYGNTSATSITLYNNPTISVSYICVGH